LSHNYKDARVHCEVLNTRATTTPPNPHRGPAGDGPHRETRPHVSEPSGPNSVLRPTHHPPRRSTPPPPTNGGSGSTDDADHAQAYQSMFHNTGASPAADERCDTRRHGHPHHSRDATGSLERR